MVEDRLKERTLSAVFWKMLERFGGQIVSLIVTIVMARLLTPAEYGVIAVILVLTNLAGIFVQSGLNSALIQSPIVADDDYSTVFWLSFVIATIFAIILFAAAPLVASFYSMPDLCWPMRVYVLALFINAYNSIQVAKVTRDLELQKTFISTFSAGCISGVLGIVLALAGLGVWALVAQQLASGLAGCVILAALVSWKPRRVFDSCRAKELFSFGGMLMLSSVCYNIYQYAADLIIGKVFNSAQLGLVSKAKQWPQALLTALDASVRSVMLSSASKVQDDLLRLARIASKSIQLISFVIVPAMACLALVAYPLTVLLIGEQWAESVPYMQLYCIYCAMRGLGGANGEVISALGHSDIYFKSDLIQLILGMALLAISSFVLRDLYAMIASYIITRVAITFYGAIKIRELVGYRLRDQLSDCGPSFLLSLICFAIAYPVSFAELPLVALLIIQAGIFFAAYFTLSQLLHVKGFEYLRFSISSVIQTRRQVSFSDDCKKGGD